MAHDPAFSPAPPTPARRADHSARAMTPLAVTALGVVVALGAYFGFVDSSPLPADAWWAGVTRLTPGTAPYAVAVFCAEIGSAVGVAASVAIAAALLLVARRPRDAVTVMTTLVIGVAGSELLKSLVLRPRPDHALYPAHGSSFPSGHSMGAAALACSLALVAREAEALTARTRLIVGALAAVWALLMMWSRAALGVHWLSDTVGGALLGLAAALLARRLWASPRLTP